MRKLKCSYATVLSSIYYFIMGCQDQQVTDKETDGQFSSSFFTARCYASAVLAMGLCLCLSQVGVLLKRLNVGSHKQHNTIVQGL